MEFWAEIKGYEGVYCVSSKGKVKHLASIHKTKISGTECQRKNFETVEKVELFSCGFMEKWGKGYKVNTYPCF